MSGKTFTWSLIFIIAALIGIAGGYFYTNFTNPDLLPPMLRLGGLKEPATILVMGTDVVYSLAGRKNVADKTAFNGRSDTMILVRFDPFRNTITALSIPRDTFVLVPRFGHQKVNSANALGGPSLAMQTVKNLLNVPIDHYVVLNLAGLVKAVDIIGGITVQIPKPMKYMDWTAKLKIELEPGFHTLTGNQAMGFVRFRHDALGDIGRVQRQQLFMHAVLIKLAQPEVWTHLPQLIELEKQYLLTDMDFSDILGLANFARGVPKKNFMLSMLPGNFSGDGNWLADRQKLYDINAWFLGSYQTNIVNRNFKVAIENASSTPHLASKVSSYLRNKGYNTYIINNDNFDKTKPLVKSKIIAQKGNPQEALLVLSDLNNQGSIVNASIGDLDASVTIEAGEDLAKIVQSEE